MERANIDVSRRDKAKIILGKFTNGRLNSAMADSCKFSCVEEQDKRKSTKRKLVCETEDMTYEGQCLGCESNGVRQMLAAYNKKTGKVYLYDTQMAVMKPVIQQQKEDSDKDETDLTFREKSDNLTSAFGGLKKRRAMESRIRNKIGTDSLESAMTNAVDEVLARPDIENLRAAKAPDATAASNDIPPHDKDATSPSGAYKLEGIISPECMTALEGPAQEFVNCNNSILTSWVAEKKFPSFVTNQLSILTMVGPSRLHKSKCLKYLHYMTCLYGLSPKQLRGRGNKLPDDAPKVVQKALMDSFTVYANIPGKKETVRCMPARLKDKLLNYMMVLCLILENFNLDFTALSMDLKIGQKRMLTCLRSLGCQTKVQPLDIPGGQLKSICTATLSVPLTFPDLTVKTKKQRR